MIVNLRDGCFPDQNSASLADEAAGEAPRLLHWHRIGPGEGAGDTVVFTDMCIEEAAASPAAHKIAWLIEPPSINSQSYHDAYMHREHFDFILTHQQSFVQHVGARRGLWYPLGGSRMPAAQRVIGPKSRDICIIASEKQSAPGHRLRHEVIRHLGDRVDAYGLNYGGRVAQGEILKQYRFAVVVENEKSSDWFTEKLIDCLLVGTIPLYWGARAAVDLFDDRGIWEWDTFNALRDWLSFATPHFYDILVEGGVVAYNAQEAQRYVCVEDWLARAYPHIWSEV